MHPSRSLPAWTAGLLLAAGVVALHASAFSMGFLYDDHVLLEHAQRSGPWAALTGPDPLGHYFRPVSRALWFGLLAPLAADRAWAYHAANVGLLLAAAVLTHDLLRALTGRRGAWIGLVFLLLLPLQRILVAWISCNQDLLALTAALGAVALFRRGRDRLALVAAAVAMLSKESALPLPLVLGVWAWRIDCQPARVVLRRIAPFMLPGIVWVGGSLSVTNGAPLAAIAGGLTWAAHSAAYVHLLQALTAIEFPAHLARSLLAFSPSLSALLALALFTAATALRPAGVSPGPSDAPAPPPREVAAFALAWLVLFTLPVVPVVHEWSNYYYTLASVGGAMLVALATRGASRFAEGSLLALVFVLHVALTAVPTFATTLDPWNPGSRLTVHQLERGAALSRQLADALRRSVPSPEPNTRFFFATLPSWAGFQMGSGAAVRRLYRDSSLESWFYSQYTDTTAGEHPSVFLFWNGLDFERLHAHARDPLFEVGTDLLLLERHAGAIHAFHRGLAAGEAQADHLYMLGWAHLWNDQRAFAERAWSAFGARDDSAAHVFALRTARTALEERDTLRARRALFDAIRAGVGRPVPHAELGALLTPRHAKYGLLETMIASRLAPADWLARRDLVEGLIAAGLEDVAARQIVELHRTHPAFADDPVAVRLDSLLAARSEHDRAATRPRPRRTPTP